VDNEIETQTMDLQVEEVINESTNMPKGNVCHYYIKISGQCETDDTEMDDNKVRLNWVPNWLTNLGSGMQISNKLLLGLATLILKFNQIRSTNLQIGVQNL
jgi:hypothetical protein